MKMAFWERCLHAVLNRLLKRRDIAINDDLYMRRWYLWGRGTDSQWFLHNIRRPDAGRELHDHPWDFSTRILLGGYIEEVMVKGFAGDGVAQIVNEHGRGDSYRVAAEHTHRIDYIYGPTYTLVNTGPSRRTWGFWKSWSKDSWTDWRTYLGLPTWEPDLLEDKVR